MWKHAVCFADFERFFMNDNQKKIAQDALCEWLTEREEMGGKPPKKIEYKFALKDDENGDLIFFVFKFKKSAAGKWLIGIAGGFPDEESTDCKAVFSGFDEFPAKEEDAVELAFGMIDFILQFNMRERLKEVFEQNLKYIRQTEVDPEKIERQFVKTQTRFFLTVGTVDVPSGKVICADPLDYLEGEHIFAPVLKREIPKGSYPAEVSICRHDNIGIRMCTARLKIKDTKAVRYELAESEEDSAAMICSDGVLHGFPVDAGMMCFIDAGAAKNYQSFFDKWHKENPDKNNYYDYFKAFFEESDKKLPAYQREGGDFIEWANPDTGERMVQIASGFGDGFYQSFWGIDDIGEICELVVPLVDPDLFDN